MSDKIVLNNFWKLYGAGVLGHHIADFVPMDAEQWEIMWKLARNSVLNGMIIEGINHLPDWQKPPKEMYMQWKLKMAYNSIHHRDNNLVIADLFNRWQEAGLHPVLLKGQGFARLYKSPVLRMIGDIDVFVPRAEFQQALDVAKSLPLDDSLLHETERHITFSYRQKAIELHHHSCEVCHRKDLDDKYQQLSEAILTHSTEGFFIDESGNYAESGVWITTPPAEFNVFYAFMHLWEHVYMGESHVRTFADWLILLRRYKDQLNIAELEARLRQFHLLQGWQILGCFVVRYMGAKPEDIPLYDASQMHHVKKYHRYFTYWIIGLHNRLSKKHTLGRKFHNFGCYIHYGMLCIHMFPTKVTIKRLATWMRDGMKRIFVK